jgi:hypothetical protein
LPCDLSPWSIITIHGNARRGDRGMDVLLQESQMVWRKCEEDMASVYITTNSFVNAANAQKYKCRRQNSMPFLPSVFTYAEYAVAGKGRCHRGRRHSRLHTRKADASNDHSAQTTVLLLPSMAPMASAATTSSLFAFLFLSTFSMNASPAL